MLMLRIKKNTVTIIIHERLMRISAVGFKPRVGSRCPVTTPLAKLTMWVRGKAIAIPCAAVGKEVRGKNVPHKKNIGVRKRNDGKLKKSMFGAAAVKHIAIEANIKPPKNAKGMTIRKNGVETKPNIVTTDKTMVVLVVRLPLLLQRLLAWLLLHRRSFDSTF